MLDSFDIIENYYKYEIILIFLYNDELLDLELFMKIDKVEIGFML